MLEIYKKLCNDVLTVKIKSTDIFYEIKGKNNKFEKKKKK